MKKVGPVTEFVCSAAKSGEILLATLLVRLTLGRVRDHLFSSFYHSQYICIKNMCVTLIPNK